ncbi:protein-tyrosine phosphatase-like protein [Mycena crocata]|nr:protein-tyrosine phosphatase-like protein [Mycena crocata]
MLTFDNIPREEMEAMCTPMHRVLSPTPIPAPTTTSPQNMNGNDNGTQKPTADATGALYLGSMAAAHDRDLLREHRVNHLVQVLEVPWQPQSDDAEFSYHRIDIEDRSSAALSGHLAEACDYIRTSLKNGDNVLVHCQQGVSRSASIVIAYLIRDRAMTYDSAFELVKRRRQCIKPNSGFVKALREWESACKIKIPGADSTSR